METLHRLLLEHKAFVSKKLGPENKYQGVSQRRLNFFPCVARTIFRVKVTFNFTILFGVTRPCWFHTCYHEGYTDEVGELIEVEQSSTVQC